jgi:hypothetical protein
MRIGKLGKSNKNARPAFARPRFCPVCEKTKAANDFRWSNRDPRLAIICLQCRIKNPNAYEDFFTKRTRRGLSEFRKKFWAVAKLVRNGKLKKEVNELSVKKQSLDLIRFPERVAAILGKTYAVMGDDFKLADDEALTRIRDLLEELDPTLIDRNKRKRLSRIS